MLKPLIKKILGQRITTALKKTVENLNPPSYYCAALHGDSNYNICINSDMTVSCNCMDFDGTGHIGDLRTQTMDEVFSGDTARHFRKSLARGEFPIPNCEKCNELRKVTPKEADHYLDNFNLPKRGIMLENTVLCNYECLACDREVVNTRSKRRMSPEEMERIAKMLGEMSIEEIAFHNLGEPFFSRNICHDLALVRQYNPEAKLVMSTNGTFLDTDERRDAALLLNILYFSIDGAEQSSVEKYQVGAEFETSLTNLKNMVAYRDARGTNLPHIEWKYVVFNWNDSEEEIERAVRLAKEARVDSISFWHGWGEQAYESTQFPHAKHFQSLGEENWKGRELILR
jgi:uncharacterized Fe-S cluster-containing radical SAM superfamily protein